MEFSYYDLGYFVLKAFVNVTYYVTWSAFILYIISTVVFTVNLMFSKSEEATVLYSKNFASAVISLVMSIVVLFGILAPAKTYFDNTQLVYHVKQDK